MDNEGPEPKRFSWTPTMDRYLTDLLVKEVRKGKKSEKGFKKSAWTTVVPLFNEKFNLHCDSQHMKNRMKTWRKQYVAVKTLLEQSGFRWDEGRKMVMADDNVWDDYQRAHPNTRTYRNKSVPNYTELGLILGNDIADGSFSQTGLAEQTHAGISQMEDVGVTSVDLDREVPMQSMDQENADESSNSGGEVRGSRKGRKRQSTTPSSSKHGGKARKPSTEHLYDQIGKMACAVDKLISLKQSNQTSSSPASTWMQALEEVPNIDEDLFLDACGLLEDDKKANTFLALRADLRKKWLIKILRP